MKRSDKQQRKLAQRVKDYEAMVAKPGFNAAGYRRPGSNK